MQKTLEEQSKSNEGRKPIVADIHRRADPAGMAYQMIGRAECGDERDLAFTLRVAVMKTRPRPLAIGRNRHASVAGAGVEVARNGPGPPSAYFNTRQDGFTIRLEDEIVKHPAIRRKRHQ